MVERRRHDSFAGLGPIIRQGSFGSRPRRGPLRALGPARDLAIKERRRVWLVADLKDAFSNVPGLRLLPVLRKLLPAAELVDFLGGVLSPGRCPGLRQGGPLSPLMLNVYLNHFLDRPGAATIPGFP